ncbi:3-hydroxyacyl-CoA dehydrogenase [Maritimibacter sp. DP07]|uniref:3-hydroxyacyl-CoA dehydrogenase n=1 Tax=Maritimibacter harenae TaxID=2606218 RepID=A0A845LY25_9RHOB|nr:3-hydroxyacyl-CoA dehydrogenase NAD-binding domain-containing protein [Maritimibacter harenae]MZR11679.1 3-hydroxyacyl-CoA dehydrogenase [Maritimibacter harenae]
MIECDIGTDGIAILTVATPGPVNALSRAFNVAFDEAVEAVLADDLVRAVIVTSSKNDFAIGGDLDELRAAMTPAAVAQIVDPFNAALRRLETCGKPVVAAMTGSALGGGYELALACNHRIAADRPRAVFGLPEAGLGLMPGAGGTQRLPRLIGIAPAADLMLRGRVLSGADALKAGLIDELVAPEDLIPAARRWLDSAPEPTQPWDRHGFSAPGDDPNSRPGRMFFAAQWAKVRARSAGTNAAAMAILHVLHHGMERRLDPALIVERRQFLRIAASLEAKNTVRSLFYGLRAAAPKPETAVGHDLRKLGVVGGGAMGCGIAFSAARAGYDVALIDVSDEQARAALARIGKIGARQVERGHLTHGECDTLLARISTGVDYAALSDADLAVEAVFEQPALKRDVIARMAAALPAGATIASNTSTIPIAQLARDLDDPGRMVGMHFFAPVETMKLLEIIHGPDSTARARADAQTLAKDLRKAVIVVNDGLGFYTSRLVSSLSSEAMTMVAEGIAPQIADRMMTNAGFAIGPMSLADLTTLPLLRDIMLSMSGEGRPVSMTGSRAVEALEAMVAAGRIGKASGAGIYDYDPANGQRLWPGLGGLFVPATLAPELIAQRLLNTQTLEAVRALEDGTVTDPLTADMAAVTGWAYPAHLGGPFAYVDTVGAATFVRECDTLADRFGERFAVPGTLRDMARSSARFHTI